MVKRLSLLMALIMIISSIALAPVVAKAEPISVLRLGDEGEAIRLLQNQLRKKGYFAPEESTTYYGIITQHSVSAFQRQNGLEPDGVAGPATLKLLFGSDYDNFIKQGGELNSHATSYTGTGTREYSETPLRPGDEGEEVFTLQTKLKELGLFSAEVTGFYGDMTQDAVRKYQESKGLEVDGVAGTKTLAALYATSPSESTPRKYSIDTLIPGDEGTEVAKLQTRLKELGYYDYQVTGFFGPITSEAVKKFQRAHSGLEADGLAGKNTRNVLYGDNAISASKATAAASSNTNKSPSSKEATAANIIDYAKQFLDTPYVYGANGPDAFDCTGFTCYVFKQFGISLPRTARDQGYTDYGTKISSVSDLKPGDLVFFNTLSSSSLSDHAGIYIGGGQFIHASSGSGGVGRCVKISPLDSGYYQRAFSWGRRVL